VKNIGGNDEAIRALLETLLERILGNVEDLY
jgi:hypothetical protein